MSKNPEKEGDDLTSDVITKSRVSKFDQLRSDRGDEDISDDDSNQVDGMIEPIVMLSDKQEKPTSTLSGHDGLIICLDFNQNGSLLASGCATGIVNIWSMQVV